MRLSGITPESFIDGPGLRYVIFTQGCPHQCPHCQNQKTWDFNGGEEFSVRQLVRLLKKHKKPIQGITFSGGEPFSQAAELAQAALAAHELGWDVVTYSGFTYEELAADNTDGVQALLAASDILIDGRYIHKQRSIKLKFRGSSNQRIIDMAQTRKAGELVLWDSAVDTSAQK